MGRSTRVISAGDHHRIPIMDGHGFVQFPVIGINPLKGKPLTWIETMIINLLQSRFFREFIRIMLVRGITGPAAPRGDHFRDKQAVGSFSLRKDIADMTGVGGSSPGFASHAFRTDQPCKMTAGTWCLANRQFQIGQGPHPELILIGKINRIR